MHSRRITAAVLTIIVIFAMGQTYAGVIQIPSQQLAIISPPQNDSTFQHGVRLLMRFCFPDSLLGKRILYAELWLPFSLVSLTDSTLRFDVFTVSTTWDENTVTWNYPWQIPGGDIDSLSCSSRYFTLGTNDTLNLDLTSVVRGWVSLGRRNDGFLVTVNCLDRQGLRYNLSPLLPFMRSSLSLKIRFDNGPIPY
jgi:hypothetical protein